MNTLRGRLTYANVMSTFAVFLLLGGAAYAATALKKDSVKSKQIAAGAVKTPEISANAVTADKLAPGLSTQGARGPEGPQGQAGSSIFEGSIPSGESVTGLFLFNDSSPSGLMTERESVTFPIPAPVALEDADIGFGLGEAGPSGPSTAIIQGVVQDDEEDAACTGNAGAPSAPPGHLCFYLGGPDPANVAPNSVNTFPGTGNGTTPFERRSGALFTLARNAAGVTTLRGIWAYTAP